MNKAILQGTKTTDGTKERHPKGLYVLFATEMWERFGFYSMLSMFTLYLQHPVQGFGWTTAQATSVYSSYIGFVYASPLIGGWIADRFTGFRSAINIGGILLAAGYLMLALPSVPMLYAALTILVIGNGFFKPNVSALVGNLYREGSPLKDSAYNIFYMGINIGAFAAPIVAEIVWQRLGFRVAFTVASFGMVVSLLLFWGLRRHLGGQNMGKSEASRQLPTSSSQNAIETVPDSRRVMALVVIFLIVIVFWMTFHQNGSTLTYWANNNTAWNVSGVISNAINPFWIVSLTFPLIYFWRWLSKRGLEPSTPAKMAFGMLLTAVSFYIMFLAALSGGDTGKVSPWWLVGSYAVISLGELMLSPMGLSLVSKVAPARMRGVMMGGWFVATAIGSKLTVIGVYWDTWKHSSFFFLLASMALIMAGVLVVLLKPLKRAMPGV